MKKIIIIRHAKSSWDMAMISDFDRKLNDRGKKEASFVGSQIAQQFTPPDIFIASPARRTIKTAKKIAKKLQFDNQKIIREMRLYNAPLSQILEIIAETSDNLETLYICAHNPGVSDLIRYLTLKEIPEMVPAASYELLLHINSWTEELKGKGIVQFEIAPPQKW